MAYSSPYTFTALELLTAAKMNAIQDNITAIWKGTTAGDTDYYASSTSKNRLAIGTAYQFLQVNTGATAPQWGGLHFASVYHNTTQNVLTATDTTLLFNSENSDVQAWHDTGSNTGRITVGVTGYYVFSVSFYYTGAGGSGTYRDYIQFKINGATEHLLTQYQEVSADNKAYMITTPVMPMTAAQYMEVTLTQSSGGTRAVQADATFSAWRVV